MPVPFSDLLCGESLAGDDDSPERPGEAEFPDDSDESMAGFLEGEASYSPDSGYSDRFRSNSLDLVARADSVAWILKVREYYRFLPLTAYLSVNYMDRFLSAHRLPQANGWPLQLLSVACLSLAAKMEETMVPSLLDLQVEGARFIFEPRTIRRMELLVLTALDWRLRSVTPFTFIEFFAYKVDPTGVYMRNLVSHATQIILATMRGVDFLEHCPSSIAAAAIISGASSIHDLDFITPRDAITWCKGLTREGISNCYDLMQEVVMDYMQRKLPKILPQLRVMTPENMGSGASSASSSSPNKRRKLNNNLWVDDDKGM